MVCSTSSAVLTGQRIWDEHGGQVAVLRHPCTSVWAATSCSDGIVVTGGSDGIVRVWRQMRDGVEQAVEARCTAETQLSPVTANAEEQTLVDTIVIDVDVA